MYRCGCFVMGQLDHQSLTALGEACWRLPCRKGRDQPRNDRVSICLGIGIGKLGMGDPRVVAILLHERDAGFRLGAFAYQLGYCLWPSDGRRLTERGARQDKQRKKHPGADDWHSPPLTSENMLAFFRASK